jgi:hypothetical protein
MFLISYIHGILYHGILYEDQVKPFKLIKRSLNQYL